MRESPICQQNQCRVPRIPNQITGPSAQNVTVDTPPRIDYSVPRVCGPRRVAPLQRGQGFTDEEWGATRWGPVEDTNNLAKIIHCGLRTAGSPEPCCVVIFHATQLLRLPWSFLHL